MASLTVLVGFPASGKSTWANANGGIILSSDAIRAELFGSEEIQGNPAEVFGTLKKRLIENLKKGNNVIVDATSISRWERSDYIKIAHEYNAIPIAVVFDTPIAECKRRNQNRKRKVPEFVYDKMASKYEEPSTDEGFKAVFHMSDDLYDMCDKCQFKWQCSSWTNKSVCGRNYAEWEHEAKRCRDYMKGEERK